jgi:hypothetical protein
LQDELRISYDYCSILSFVLVLWDLAVVAFIFVEDKMVMRPAATGIMVAIKLSFASALPRF